MKNMKENEKLFITNFRQLIKERQSFEVWDTIIYIKEKLENEKKKQGIKMRYIVTFDNKRENVEIIAHYKQ